MGQYTLAPEHREDFATLLKSLNDEKPQGTPEINFDSLAEADRWSKPHSQEVEKFWELMMSRKNPVKTSIQVPHPNCQEIFKLDIVRVLVQDSSAGNAGLGGVQVKLTPEVDISDQQRAWAPASQLEKIRETVIGATNSDGEVTGLSMPIVNYRWSAAKSGYVVESAATDNVDLGTNGILKREHIEPPVRSGPPPPPGQKRQFKPHITIRLRYDPIPALAQKILEERLTKGVEHGRGDSKIFYIIPNVDSAIDAALKEEQLPEKSKDSVYRELRSIAEPGTSKSLFQTKQNYFFQINRQAEHGAHDEFLCFEHLEVDSNLQEIPISNEQRNWLTYETRFNWAPFCKTNQKFEAAAYRVPAERMSVLLAPPEDLDDETLATLCNVFFPTVKTPGGSVDLSRMRKIGRLPWETRSLEFEPPVVDGIHASGGLGAAKQEHYIVMPYNLRDNKSSSAAIGTRASSTQQKIPLRNFSNTLPMWNSSSRSSVMDFTGVETKNWIASQSDSNNGEAFLWPEDKFGETKALRFMEPDQASDNQFKIPNDPNYHQKIFSVKTGVNLIGFAVQESKAKLEHNSILAALRSAFIGDTERQFRFDSYNDPHLLILKEILTVTERDPDQKLWFDLKTNRDYWSDKNPDTIGKLRKIVQQPKFGDGLQVRSLRGMKYDHEYFPPTSIPFVGVKGDRINEKSECVFSHNAADLNPGESEQNWVKDGMPRSLSAFKHIDDQAWCGFWEKHYAEPLGRTKAMLLLRYALQGFGGNAQNYLLETKDGKPTGRIVLRDMGDYALHDFVLWAMFGPKHETPPDSRSRGVGQHGSDVESWKKAFANHTLLHFECDVLHQFNHDYTSPSSPGEISEFPTFTGYHRANVTGMHTFNPFCDCCEDGPFVGHISPLWAYAMPVGPNAIKRFHSDISASRWAKIMEVQTKWGIAHAKSWLGYISKALSHGSSNKVDFSIDFKPVPFSEIESHSKPTSVHCPSDYQSIKTTTDDGREIYSGGYGESGKVAQEKAARTFESIMVQMSDFYQAFKNWEMHIGMQVENFLRTQDGQDAIRNYLQNWQSIDG